MEGFPNKRQTCAMVLTDPLHGVARMVMHLVVGMLNNHLSVMSKGHVKRFDRDATGCGFNGIHDLAGDSCPPRPFQRVPE